MGSLACSAANSIGTLGNGTAFPLGFTGGAIAQLLAYKTSSLFCNKNPYDAPFKPGLCPIRYRVTITYQITNHPFPQFNGTFTKQTLVWGEVGSATYRRRSDGGGGSRELLNIGLTAYGSGDFPRLTAPVTEFFPDEEFNRLARIVILNVEATPFDPLEGPGCIVNNEPSPYDPANFTYNINVDVDVDGGNSYTIPFVAVIGQLFVDADLNLNMPFTFKPSLTANLNLDFEPEFNATLNLSTGDTKIDFDYGDNFIPPSSPGDDAGDKPGIRPDVPIPPKPPAVPDAVPDPEDEAAGRTIIAAIVTTTSQGQPTRLTVIGQDNNPDVWAPNVGLIAFAIQTETGEVAWTNDIFVKNERAYIPCPAPEGAIAVRGTPQLGNVWTVTPVYKASKLLAGGG